MHRLAEEGKMSRNSAKPLALFVGRWRLWLPPVIFAIVIFLGAVLLTRGKETLFFSYHVF
jgi:hypothetical protein